MDNFDLDLEDLDLKSVDITHSKPATPNNSFKNINVDNNRTGIQASNNPNLTVSTNNYDAMPSMGNSTDKSFDLGLDLLMNKKKVRADFTEINKLSPTASHTNNNNMFNSSSNNTNTNSTASGFPSRINIDETELLQSSLFSDNMTNIDLEKELNTMDLNDITKPIPSMTGPSLPTFTQQNANGTTNYGFNNSNANNSNINMGSGSSGGGFGGGGGGGSINNNVQQMSFEEIQQKKFDLLCKFERLRDKGIKLPKTFSMSSSWDEMDMEYRRLVEHRQLDNSVKTQKKMLLSFVSGIEMLNNKFDPFELQLNGWSENINESLNDNEYDQIFEDLFYKYKDTVNMAPELKLAGMIAMSGFWYHITQNMAKSFMPNIMNNVMKQNPDLMNQFQQATMNSVKQTNPQFANFAQSMGTQNNGPPKYNPMNGPPFSNPKDAPPRGQTHINQVDDIDALIDSIN